MLRLWLSLLLAAAPFGSPAAAGEVLVSAGSSLSVVLQEIARAYERSGGDRLVLNFGASNTLARQIRAGARVDLFISADEAQMNGVAADIVPGTRVDLLANQLAIAVAGDRPGAVRSARDLAAAAVRRIAIGDPAAVPAGVYAKAYLEQQGLWTRLQPKLVPSGSVRLALAAVEQGGADAAIVYRTDVASAKRARTAFIVPVKDGPRIVYPAAIIRTGSNIAGARRVLAFLRSAPARAMFERAGFSAPPRPAGAAAADVVR